MNSNRKTKQPTISYMICATPRSGSTLLCEALRNSGLAGNPDEYFGPMHVKRWTEQWQTKSDKEYLAQAMAHGRGNNGVWGVKIMRLYWHNFITFLQDATDFANMTEAQMLQTCFPNLHFIWITRRDKVRQAISWLKFMQGSAWYWDDEEPQQLAGLEFKLEVIQDFILQTTLHETAWQEFFQKLNVQPYILVYEDFINRYEETAIDILKYLGIPHSKKLAFGQRRLKKQADALTDEWVQKVLELSRDSEKM